MKKSWFTVQAAADGRTAQVAVRGYIGEWGVTDRDFIAAVEAYGDVSTIDVAVNSRGGEVDHALSIFNFLRNHPAQVNMRVDGVAMSAASIILMAGDTIAMPANAILMVHSPSLESFGNAAEHRKAADVLDTFEAALLETYQARTKMSADELKALLADETFMTASEAVAKGFADTVLPLAAAARATSAMAYASALDIPLDVLVRAQREALADDDAAAADGAADDESAASGAAAVGSEAAEAAALIAVPQSLSSKIAAAAADAGLSDFVSCFALDATLTDLPTAQAALADAREVVDLCAMVGMNDAAESLIRSRSSLATARATLQARLAEIDEASHTDNAQQSGASIASASSNVVSASSIWEARRAQSAQGRARA